MFFENEKLLFEVLFGWDEVDDRFEGWLLVILKCECNIVFMCFE